MRPPWSYYRLVGTIGLLVASVGAASYYAYRTPVERPGRVSVTAYLGELGPFWPMLFALAALLLLVTLATGRFVVATHSITAGVFVAYGVGTALSAALSHPPTGWVTSTFALALAAHALVLTRVAARERVWTQH